MKYTQNYNLKKPEGTDVVNIDDLNYNADVIDTELAKRIINSGNVPSIQAGLDASKPAPGTVGRLYVATDTQIIYRDTGTAWQKVGAVKWDDIDGKPTSFTPSAHKSTHASGGSDPLTPADIGAVNKAGDTMTGGLTVPFLTANAPNTHIRFQENGVNKWHIESVDGVLMFVETGVALRAQMNPSGGDFKWNGNTVWHAGNSPSAQVITLYAGNFLQILVTSPGALLGTNFTWNSTYATGRNIYFEAYFGASGTNTAYVSLYDKTASSSIITLSTTTEGLYRSTAISIPDGHTIGVSPYSSSTSYPCNLWAARLIII